MGLFQPDAVRQIVPGWYVLYQPHTTIPWIDVGRVEVINDPNVPKGKIETFYLNLDASASGGGLSGTEPRGVYEWPGSAGHTTESIKFVKATGSLGQPAGIRSSRIICVCSAPVTVGP